MSPGLSVLEDARKRFSDETGAPSSGINREVWEAIAAILAAYGSKADGALTGNMIEPLPAPVAHILEEQIKYVSILVKQKIHS